MFLSPPQEGDGMIDELMVSAGFLLGFSGAWHCLE